MKKIALILCLVLVASFVLSGCNNSDSIITLEDREVGKIEIQSDIKNLEEELRESESKISEHIYHELDLIGVTAKLKGRKYIHDAILYLIQNENSNINVIQHLTKIYKKSGNTITNGNQNAIIHAWRVSSIEDLTTYYTAKVNYETGIPTPMEFIYYYVDKIKKTI